MTLTTKERGIKTYYTIIFKRQKEKRKDCVIKTDKKFKEISSCNRWKFDI